MWFWNWIGNQLQHPTGVAGRLVGRVMGFLNERPNRLAVDALRIGARDTVLELGFGPGRAIELMAARAPQGVIYGVDQSEIMLEQAKRRNRPAIREGRVLLYRAPFDHLPFVDQSIDKVLAVNVVYFWEDPVGVMKEIRRVLRPNGCVSIYATDAKTMRNWRFAGPETHRLFRAAELNDLLLLGGFDRNRVFVRSVQVTGRANGLLATVSTFGNLASLRRR
jgi:SAM-dependent methyltransferase